MTTLTITQDHESKWHTSTITTIKGPIAEIREHIPHFERRTFGLELKPTKERDEGLLFTDPAVLAGSNRFYDSIVRVPLPGENLPPIPVGIVSRQYSLIQHRDLIDETVKALSTVKIDLAEIKATVNLTEYGERMRLGLLLPPEYSIDPAPGDRMGLRLECFNSVDGSMKFMAVMGWLRFVCSNGMIVGVANTDFRRRHNRSLELADIVEVLRDGIAATTDELKIYKTWRNRAVSAAKLEAWVNETLAKEWGVKAAVRTWHIVRSGVDVEMVDLFEKGLPTEKTVVAGQAVPGAVLPGDNAYAVSQALSWLAKERRDIQEQLEWQRQIPELMRPLLGKAA